MILAVSSNPYTNHKVHAAKQADKQHHIAITECGRVIKLAYLTSERCTDTKLGCKLCKRVIRHRARQTKEQIARARYRV